MARRKTKAPTLFGSSSVAAATVPVAKMAPAKGHGDEMPADWPRIGGKPVQCPNDRCPRAKTCALFNRPVWPVSARVWHRFAASQDEPCAHFRQMA